VSYVYGGGGLRHGSINICIVEQGQLSEKTTTTVVTVAASMSLEHMVRRQAETTTMQGRHLRTTILYHTELLFLLLI